MRRINLNWRLALVGAIVLGFFVYGLCRQQTSQNPGPDIIIPTDNLTVYFYDVGQGDAVLVDCGAYECLIDAGPEAPAIDAGIIQEPLEDVVATHPHADHIGGLPEVFNRFQVSNFCHNGQVAGTAAYADMIGAAQEAVTHVAHDGDYIKTLGYHGGYGDGLTVQVLHSGGSTEANDASVVVEVRYLDSSWLFMGDAQTGAEDDMLAKGLVHHNDVLKVGHHGSCTGTSQAFLAAVSPQIAVVSVGEGNTYGHPCPAVLGYLQAQGVAIYRTDSLGTVVLGSDGDEPEAVN